MRAKGIFPFFMTNILYRAGEKNASIFPSSAKCILWNCRALSFTICFSSVSFLPDRLICDVYLSRVTSFVRKNLQQQSANENASATE